MRYRFPLLLCFLSLTFAASSQITHTSQGNVDKQAQSILQKAAALFNGDAVSFKVTMVNYTSSKKESARQSAQILFHKGAYRVLLDDQSLFCDGKTVWHFNKATNEVVVSTLDDASDDLMNPALLLSSYNKNFKSKYIRTDDKGNAIVDLSPKKGMSYHKLRLIIQQSSGQLLKMEIHNYDSSRGEYIISNFKTKVKYSASDFSFNAKAHPNVEVIDMR